MKKRALAGFLALTTVLGMSATVFASAEKEIDFENGAYGAKFEFTSGANVPTIEIDLPSEVAFVLNPYGLEVTEEGFDGEHFDAVADANAQIVCPDYEITNNSDVPIQVGASAMAIPTPADKTSTKPASKAVLATTSTAEGSTALTTNSVFAYFEMAEDADSYKASYAADSGTQILLGAKEVKKDNLMLLDEEDGAAVFTIKGDMVKVPAKAWEDTDTIKATLKFTFVPQALAPTEDAGDN